MWLIVQQFDETEKLDDEMLPLHSYILSKAIRMWNSQLQYSPKKKVRTIPTVPHTPPTAT